MKRDNYLIEKIACPDNLRLAFWKASKGKNGKEEIEYYRNTLDKNLFELRKQILSGIIRVGDYHYFKIYDPKERQICAAAFKERVLHHALINICHTNFDKYQLFDSYACRLNKGTYAALDRARIFQQKYKWFLKLDIRKYFDSIDHKILKSLLTKRFKENRLLLLWESIIDSYETAKGKGLPIGNLTSQYFANHYLGMADHYLKEQLGPFPYIRYMDDMLLWGNDKKLLLDVGISFENFILKKLLLHMKTFCLNKTSKGVPFLGYVIFPDRVRLNRKSKLRARLKLKDYSHKLQNREWTEKTYQQHILPLLAFIRYADSYGFRKQEFCIS